MDTIWNKTGILELEYCRISRAAQLLNCTTEDIIHWAQQERIELCVKVYDVRCSLLLPTLDAEERVKFLMSMMIGSDQKGFICEGNEFISSSPLISIYLDKLFDFKEESEFSEFTEILIKKSGYPVAIDGLWAFDSKFLDYYDPEYPPVLGDKVSEDMSMGVKMLELLEFEIPSGTAQMMSENSFKLQAPDADDVSPFWVMVGVLDNPIILEEKNLYITKKQINKIYSSTVENASLNTSGGKSKVNVTAKQSAFTVSLLRDLGLTDDDLKGSITSLRQKIARLSPGSLMPEDDKPIIDWLRKGGVDR